MSIFSDILYVINVMLFIIITVEAWFYLKKYLEKKVEHKEHTKEP